MSVITPSAIDMTAKFYGGMRPPQWVNAAVKFGHAKTIDGVMTCFTPKVSPAAVEQKLMPLFALRNTAPAF